MLTPLPHSPAQRTRLRFFRAAESAGFASSLVAIAALLTCGEAQAQAQPQAQAPDRPVVVDPALPGLATGMPAIGMAATGGKPAPIPAKIKPQRTMALAEHFSASEGLTLAPMPPTIFIGQRRELQIILPADLRPSDALRQELSKRALDSRRAQLYGNFTDDMPELLEDDFIRREQARAAESVIGSAVEKALMVAFQGGVRHESSVTFRPEFTTVEHGFKVDASPTWSYKVRALRSGIRFDLPLTPRPLRVQAWRDLRGTDRTPLRLGGGITLDPFDHSVRCSVTLEF